MGSPTRLISKKDSEIFIEMALIQSFFRMLNAKNFFEELPDKYLGGSQKIKDEWILQCIEQNNVSNEFLSEEIDNLDKLLNDTEQRIIYELKIKIYKNNLPLFINHFKYCYVFNYNADVLITSDVGIVCNQTSDIVYFPISPSHMIILSSRPCKTSMIDLEIAKKINSCLKSDCEMFYLYNPSYIPFKSEKEDKEL